MEPGRRFASEHGTICGAFDSVGVDKVYNLFSMFKSQMKQTSYSAHEFDTVNESITHQQIFETARDSKKIGEKLIIGLSLFPSNHSM